MKMMTPDEIIRQCPRLIENIERARLMQYWGEYLCGERVSPDSDIDTRALFITIFEDEKANKKFIGEHSLTSWAHHILKTDAPTKADTPWLKLAKFGNLKTEKNCLRHDANVQQITGIEVDYDGEQISFEQACDTIRDAGIRALLYTSASHTKEKPRWRILVPLSKDYPPASRAPMVGRINGLFNGSLAPESFVLSTSYHYGSVNHNPHHQAVVMDGRFLDLNDRLHAGSIDQYGHRVGNKEFEQTKSKPERSREPGNAFSEYNSKPADKNEIIAALAVIDPDCGWRLWYKLASAIWYELRDEGEEVFHSFSARSAKYNKKQCEKKWSEAVGNALHSAGTIFYQATLANPDWRDEYKCDSAPNYDSEDPGHGSASQSQGKAKGPQGWPFKSAKDFSTEINKAWIIKGVIAPNEISNWCGLPKSGKSALVGDLAMHVCAGINWRGYRSKQSGGVVYFALERADLVERRWNAQAAQYDLRPEALPFAVVNWTIDMIHPSCVNDFIATIRAAETVMGVKVRMIVIDTSSKAIAAGGGDENLAKDKNVMRANVRRVMLAIEGLHVALISHTGKDVEKGERGSNAGLGDDDMFIQLDGKLADVKQRNDGATGPLTAYAVKGVVLGIDEDGDTIDIGIIDPDTTAKAKARERDRQTLTNPQRLALTALDRAITDNGKPMPVGSDYPKNVRTCTSLDHWRSVFKSLSDGKNPKSVDTAFQRAQTFLKVEGWIGGWNDNVWIAYA